MNARIGNGAWLARILAVVVLCDLSMAAAGHAQQGQARSRRWTIDPQASLAWFQMSPHLNHLWGTTCPQDPNWRPGEGRSAGWNINPALKNAETGWAATEDTVHVPLYPRHKVRPLCSEAVHGDVSVADVTGWRGVRGQVSVKADEIVGGEDRRDKLMHTGILNTNRYPEIGFTVDSIVNVVQRGDSLRGTAMGVIKLHGVEKAMTASIRAWPDRTTGGFRVQGKIRMPAGQLTTVYGLSKFSLGLGIGVGMWKDLFLGVDLLMRPADDAPASRGE